MSEGSGASTLAGNPTVIAEGDETLSEVIDRLRQAARGGQAVDLVVPIDSPHLLTAREFRSLKDVIDEERLPVVLRTADPLRLRLGDRLGVPVRAMARPRPVPASAPILLPAEPELVAPAEPFVSLDDALPSVDATSARPDPTSHWPAQTDEVDTADTTATDAAETGAKRLWSANPPRRWLPVAAALVLLVAATFFLIRFIVPHAVIQVVPRSEPVTASLLFDVTPDGQPMDGAAAFAVKPGTRQLDLTWEGSIPVTGTRLEPDGVATGPIELRNVSDQEVTVEAGTRVSTEEGVEFAFAEAVTVPARDAATGAPGAATGTIQAVGAGATGNVETGEVGGRLPSGVYYSNRMSPTTGGTDKEFPVVAQADLDALSAQARESADDLAAAALEGEGLGISAVEVKEQKDEFDHPVDADAETVSLTATLTVDATTFDAAAAAEQFEPLLVERLQAAAPEGFVIDAEDLEFEEPRGVSAPGKGIRLEVTARGNAVALLDDAERAALAERLAGASADDLPGILAQFPEVAGYTVDNSPGWFAGQMPTSASRIQIILAEP